jgi:hypothetical protein
MTEEEKLAYNKGYSEGYKKGRQWADGRLSDDGWTLMNTLELAFLVFTAGIFIIDLLHRTGTI